MIKKTKFKKKAKKGRKRSITKMNKNRRIKFQRKEIKIDSKLFQ